MVKQQEVKNIDEAKKRIEEVLKKVKKVPPPYDTRSNNRPKRK
jgi:2-C-methyl-D-erythritol 4-phosphate cytidylyltransferase